MNALASDTGMVLAAGLGTRMRPLTNDRPKPLVEVAGKPLIDHALDRLVEAGVARAVVNVHYFGDAVEIRDNEVPVFWACGVTPQCALMQARLPIAITHAPGHMFVTDRSDRSLLEGASEL